jgi:hypothetical protein
LEAFAVGRDDFPTTAELNAAGRSDLRRAIADYGGAEYWAGELGLVLHPSQRSIPRLTRHYLAFPSDPRSAWAEAAELRSARFPDDTRRQLTRDIEAVESTVNAHGVERFELMGFHIVVLFGADGRLVEAVARLRNHGLLDVAGSGLVEGRRPSRDAGRNPDGGD